MMASKCSRRFFHREHLTSRRTFSTAPSSAPVPGGGLWYPWTRGLAAHGQPRFGEGRTSESCKPLAELTPRPILPVLLQCSTDNPVCIVETSLNPVGESHHLYKCLKSSALRDIRGYNFFTNV